MEKMAKGGAAAQSGGSNTGIIIAVAAVGLVGVVGIYFLFFNNTIAPVPVISAQPAASASTGAIGGCDDGSAPVNGVCMDGTIPSGMPVATTPIISTGGLSLSDQTLLSSANPLEQSALQQAMLARNAGMATPQQLALIQQITATYSRQGGYSGNNRQYPKREYNNGICSDRSTPINGRCANGSIVSSLIPDSRNLVTREEQICRTQYPNSPAQLQLCLEQAATGSTTGGGYKVYDTGKKLVNYDSWL